MKSLKEFSVRLLSRKFIVVVASLIIICVNARYPFLSQDQEVHLVVVVIGYLASQGYVDGKAAGYISEDDIQSAISQLNTLKNDAKNVANV